MTSSPTTARLSHLESGIPAWVAYDFINSLLIINGSLYFSAWITRDQGVNPFWYGLTFSLSTLVLLLLLPLKGALIDRHGFGRQLLIGTSFFIGLGAVLLFGLGHRSEP